jgi:LmbE family N-acetylglucosaminyl deacetylase
LLVLVVLALVAIPLAAILYPFLRRRGLHDVLTEAEPGEELDRRWDAALAGLRSAELEHAIGTLGEEDYQVLRDQYMTEAALVLRSLEMEAGREAELLARVEEEIRRVREGFLGSDKDSGTEEQE